MQEIHIKNYNQHLLLFKTLNIYNLIMRFYCNYMHFFLNEECTQYKFQFVTISTLRSACVHKSEALFLFNKKLTPVPSPNGEGREYC